VIPRIAVVEDDPWKRGALVDRLAASREVEVVAALDQDDVAGRAESFWTSVEVALVDVYDEQAPGEVGTDLYSGITAIERLTPLKVTVVAVIPHTPHPLVQLRLAHANPDRVYRRWELDDVSRVLDALQADGPDRRPAWPLVDALRRCGAERAHPNAAVAAYLDSPLSGMLRPELRLSEIGLSRRQVDQLRFSIGRTGFSGTEQLSGAQRAVLAPRWPDVRDYLLRLLGRLDAPASDHDHL
jgi:hypothetical protein